ncbi:hypothetical protein AVEN_158235-1 [Araneus ventricosus]|uniref:Uncharacterized protein n=1 Tax=Araneus ventricosus TaxID=182803 RepID=A0A4Y2FKR0_ARAVE|nr:hypothetical protein AVEN_158235-1 [Araneus ventricosus]
MTRSVRVLRTDLRNLRLDGYHNLMLQLHPSHLGVYSSTPGWVGFRTLTTVPNPTTQPNRGYQKRPLRNSESSLGCHYLKTHEWNKSYRGLCTFVFLRNNLPENLYPDSKSECFNTDKKKKA